MNTNEIVVFLLSIIYSNVCASMTFLKDRIEERLESTPRRRVSRRVRKQQEVARQVVRILPDVSVLLRLDTVNIHKPQI